ncbi:hypothetical protein [Agromyces sp. M3QZ16-3]|uniref:hypothetical protein n=1 Tax=Agromyces sp. M3QZ16-3 TaxID=3447585 RepID=UPI003F692F79
MTLRSTELARIATAEPLLPRSLDGVDTETLDRLRRFAKLEGLTLAAALSVVRGAQLAARTELRAQSRVDAAVEASIRDRRLGFVGSSAPVDPAVEAAVSSALASTKARRG